MSLSLLNQYILALVLVKFVSASMASHPMFLSSWLWRWIHFLHTTTNYEHWMRINLLEHIFRLHVEVLWLVVTCARHDSERQEILGLNVRRWTTYVMMSFPISSTSAGLGGLSSYKIIPCWLRLYQDTSRVVLPSALIKSCQSHCQPWPCAWLRSQSHWPRQPKYQ